MVSFKKLYLSNHLQKVVRLKWKYGVKLGNATFIYSLKTDGTLKGETIFVPDTSAVTALARVGLAFEMPYAYRRGVGTATCGPGVLPQYRVPVEKHTFEFVIRPLK